ncbi:hypothetical protein FoTM2_017067 [Fusarium oxysporum f. sp. vasinfectum]|uniref:NmrA-like domain-containing protein n=1 Tax=Fusarium oxysporum f. sp. vasinfectum 25433 TaxID=1089449 RepID=X0KWI9_FUSOX|nr:hypothetical protein FOTG_18386 [Fusarium oxysporum f. sp. vasinfectum 25433]KAK2922828.1 hypothetical protein FoTM2_017067 [Fusarium oxysporum f. sp. vasinfectum]
MVSVAVAGASSGVGKVIADTVAAGSKHEYIILTRNLPAVPKAVQVDYNDIGGLVATLDKYQVNTVISGLSLATDEAGQNQANLIEAAKRALFTKRFIPSEYGSRWNRENIPPMPTYRGKLKAIRALEDSSLEFTTVYNSFFLDYLGVPHIPTTMPYAPNVFIDLENRFAAIPGDGTVCFVATHTRDVGRFVVALLGLEKWEPIYTIHGSRQTMLEAVKLAEELTGSKFIVVYDSLEKLEKGEITLTPTAVKMYKGNDQAIRLLTQQLSVFGGWLAEGHMDLDISLNSLNNEFPDIKPLTCRNIIETYLKK